MIYRTSAERIARSHDLRRADPVRRTGFRVSLTSCICGTNAYLAIVVFRPFFKEYPFYIHRIFTGYRVKHIRKISAISAKYPVNIR